MISAKKNMDKRIEKIKHHSLYNAKYHDGIRKLVNLCRRYPYLLKNVEMLTSLGILYDHLALKKGARRPFYERKALQFYNLALKVNPDSISAIWGVGRIYWHRKSKKALYYARRAYRLSGNTDERGGYAQTIGLCHEALNNLKRAEYWYMRGINEDKENNFGLYWNLILFYNKLHKTEKILLYLPTLKRLYAKRKTKLRGTLWNKQITSLINDLEKKIPGQKGNGDKRAQ